MSARVLLDLTHTSHTRARTGIQRVARSLHAALGERALAITHDPHLRAWRPLENWEKENLSAAAPAAKRSAHWPLSARLRSHFRRFVPPPSFSPDSTSGVVFPEIFSPTTAAALPSLFAAIRGPRVAIFHDAIALKFPELSPAKTVARFPGYLQELLAFDGIAAVSDDSRDSLLHWWRWLGVSRTPPIRTIPLGLDLPCSGSQIPAANPQLPQPHPIVLCVGSLEGRKNHLALLDACESLWSRGRHFELHLIGLAQRETGSAALARLRALQSLGRPLRYDGPASDDALESAYAACTFTVYPSLCEGFGLPVLESLARGKPCICSARGALGESARGGGCLALDRVDSPALAAAIECLLSSPAELAALITAARTRIFRTWPDYAADLLAFRTDLREN